MEVRLFFQAHKKDHVPLGPIPSVNVVIRGDPAAVEQLKTLAREHMKKNGWEEL